MSSARLPTRSGVLIGHGGTVPLWPFPLQIYRPLFHRISVELLALMQTGFVLFYRINTYHCPLCQPNNHQQIRYMNLIFTLRSNRAKRAERKYNEIAERAKHSSSSSFSAAALNRPSAPRSRVIIWIAGEHSGAQWKSALLRTRACRGIDMETPVPTSWTRLCVRGMYLPIKLAFWYFDLSTRSPDRTHTREAVPTAEYCGTLP